MEKFNIRTHFLHIVILIFNKPFFIEIVFGPESKHDCFPKRLNDIGIAVKTKYFRCNCCEVLGELLEKWSSLNLFTNLV